MKIGGVRITGVSKRFWYVAGGLGLFLALVFYLISSQPPPANPLVVPAFPPEKLEKQKPNWIEPYISAYGLRKPENFAAFTNNYSLNLGLPFRFRVAIPEQETLLQRPSLNVQKYGYQFVPSVFLDPTLSVSSDDLVNLEEELISGQPLVVGFPQGATPAAGQAYEVTGLLYWNSDQLKRPTGEEAEALTAPVVIAASARPLATTELEAPTTHRAELDITYQERAQQLSIHRVEWSSGRQVRVCISMTNVGSPNPLVRWSGLDEFRAEFEQSVGQGSSTAVPDEMSPLSTQQVLDLNSTITGYVIFDMPPAAAPSSGMTLYVPPLNMAGTGPPSSIEIKPDQFQDVSEIDRDSRGDASDGCYST